MTQGFDKVDMSTVLVDVSTVAENPLFDIVVRAPHASSPAAKIGYVQQNSTGNSRGLTPCSQIGFSIFAASPHMIFQG